MEYQLQQMICAHRQFGWFAFTRLDDGNFLAWCRQLRDGTAVGPQSDEAHLPVARGRQKARLRLSAEASADSV
jgi:hypothetical protein